METTELRSKISDWLKTNNIETLNSKEFLDNCVESFLEVGGDSETSLTDFLESNKNSYKLSGILSKALGYDVTVDTDIWGFMCVVSEYYSIQYGTENEHGNWYVAGMEYYSDNKLKSEDAQKITGIINENKDIAESIRESASDGFEPIDFGFSEGSAETLGDIFTISNDNFKASGFGDPFDPSGFGVDDELDFDVEYTDEEIFGDSFDEGED